jgi:response regulator RpfG family c-di-GMP phosphodiesterase
MSSRILVVDDEPHILASLQRSLRRDFTVDVAPGGAEALRMLDARDPYCVIVADMQMPGMNGVQLLATAAERHPDTVRLMLTGNADQRTAVDAVNSARIFRFLNKPCTPEVLIEAIRGAVHQYRLIAAEHELLEGTLHGAVTALTEVLSMVDPVSLGLGHELRDKMRLFLKSLKRPAHWEYEMAALLSQIGCVAIPQSVLKRTREGHGLTDAEKAMLGRIPQTGAELLAPIPRMEGVARSILYQRKRFDGGGVPIDGISGEAIPLASRILKVLVDLHELHARGMVPPGHEFACLRKREGAYDPQVLEALALCFGERPATRSPAGAEPLFIPVRELVPNHVLVSDVESADGTLLVAAGRTLTPILIEKIRNFSTLVGVREPIGVQAD